jgi:hypothetical protein
MSNLHKYLLQVPKEEITGLIQALSPKKSAHNEEALPEDDDRQALSLESQHREHLRFAHTHSLPVADILFESRSAGPWSARLQLNASTHCKKGSPRHPPLAP